MIDQPTNNPLSNQQNQFVQSSEHFSSHSAVRSTVQLPMQLPYGAVYFRKSNPPAEDWERDYRQAAQDGMNIMRHWFMWGSIEIAPGVYDWSDYDRQMELAAANGIRIIIAEITTSLPEWLFKQHPEFLVETVDGVKAKSLMGVSSATGGFYAGLCLDNPEAKALVRRFQLELINRYKDHPAILGYDIWNECNYGHDVCYCEHTRLAFREWLRRKYGTVRELGKIWHRYSYTGWNEVEPPARLGFYPESYDWLEFRKENAYGHMADTVAFFRQHDPVNLVTAHGTGQSLDNMASGGSDEWLAASEVDVYGLTFVQSRRGAAPYKQFGSLDLARAGARGKPFWHAEAQGGPLWLQPQLPGRSLEDGRITEPEDIRLWNLISFAAGARGLLFPRWRPLLDGPLFGAFGPYDMDGLPTDRSRMAARMATWSNQENQRTLLNSQPVRGDIGILVLPESQITSLLLAQFGAGHNYGPILWGCCKSFLDSNIQADFVHLDDIDQYQSIYLPYPLMIKAASAKKIIDWVAAGGRLISEGCPAYFSDHGHAGQTQPGLGFDEVFGCRQKDVRFTPDLLGGYSFIFDGHTLPGGEYLQTYELTGGQAAGWDNNENVAVCNNYGNGQALLLGTSVGKGWHDAGDSHHDYSSRTLLAKLEISPAVTSDNNQVIARLSTDASSDYLWLINTSAAEQAAVITLGDSRQISRLPLCFWQGGEWDRLDDQQLSVSIEAKNAIIMRI